MRLPVRLTRIIDLSILQAVLLAAIAITISRLFRFVHIRAHQYLLRVPPRVTCNICGWFGMIFMSNAWHRHTICPNCQLALRHRLMIAALQHLNNVSFESTIDGKVILHFAPESAIRTLIESRAANYITADYLRENVALRLDIANMKQIADRSIDTIIACDVLEHVPDDRAAMREMYRVLTPGGWVILTVPQQDNLDQTYEEPKVTSGDERERLFGQADHVRMYGNDFARRLQDAKFNVIVIAHTDFPDTITHRNVLFPPKLSSHPLATNYRKMFFAQKSE